MLLSEIPLNKNYNSLLSDCFVAYAVHVLKSITESYFELLDFREPFN